MDSAKNIIRAKAKKNREDYFKSLSESSKNQQIQKINNNILNLIPENMNGAIAGFWPMAFEADPRPALEKLIAQGRKGLLPVMQGPGKNLLFRFWKPGDRLYENAYGITEPSSKSALGEPEVMLIPLLSFDGRGHRLGYGAGYYDRTLSAFQKRKMNVLTIGVALEVQRVNELPISSYDQPLHWVVTESKVYKFI